MKDEEFARYFLQSLPNNVYGATLEFCDRFLKKHLRKALSYEQHLSAFLIFKEFLGEHNIPYSLPRSLQSSGISNYKTVEEIGKFFKETKRKMRSLQSRQQFGEQPLSPLWSQKYGSQSEETLQSLPKDVLIEKVREQDAQFERLSHLLVKQLGEALNQAIANAKPTNYTEKGDINMTDKKTSIEIGGSAGGSVVGGNVGRDASSSVGGNVSGHISPEQPRSLTEAAAEIQQLLEQLENSYPTNTTAGRMQIATEAISQIESNPTQFSRILNALKAGGVSAFEQLLNHPAASFVIGALADWQETKGS